MNLDERHFLKELKTLHYVIQRSDWGSLEWNEDHALAFIGHLLAYLRTPEPKTREGTCVLEGVSSELLSFMKIARNRAYPTRTDVKEGMLKLEIEIKRLKNNLADLKGVGFENITAGLSRPGDVCEAYRRSIKFLEEALKQVKEFDPREYSNTVQKDAIHSLYRFFSTWKKESLELVVEPLNYTRSTKLLVPATPMTMTLNCLAVIGIEINEDALRKSLERTEIQSETMTYLSQFSKVIQPVLEKPSF